MLVNYDFSSDEEGPSKGPATSGDSGKQSQKIEATQPPSHPSKKMVTLKVGNKSKAGKLPDVDKLLDAVPSNSLLENASRREESKINHGRDLESYNNVAPPDFSLAEEGEYHDKVKAKYRNRENQGINTLTGSKRKAPSSLREDNECPVMDKWFKKDDEANGNKGEPISEEPRTEAKSAKGGNPFLPPQVSQKRPNISVIEQLEGMFLAEDCILYLVSAQICICSFQIWKSIVLPWYLLACLFPSLFVIFSFLKVLTGLT
eukprot:TRINITY_DN3945_c0_g1_i11.p1 TRINITY_DN3945_c0_g1~~TRINITY_DN3945_c0_g1_i11.p1  ORF type:complete len:260 (-),score=9.03 TRINITY_DN3945_c0_g1_i11:946-1725(-)